MKGEIVSYCIIENKWKKVREVGEVWRCTYVVDEDNNWRTVIVAYFDEDYQFRQSLRVPEKTAREIAEFMTEFNGNKVSAHRVIMKRWPEAIRREIAKSS